LKLSAGIFCCVLLRILSLIVAQFAIISYYQIKIKNHEEAIVVRINLLFLIFLPLIFSSISSAQTGWYIIPGVTTESINDLNQGPGNLYWLAGNNGLIMKSSDAGKSWTQLNTGTNKNLKKMLQPASNQIWAAGDSGTVILSMNSGTDWDIVNPGTTANFRSVFSRGSGVAYVIGDSGSCYYSDDLGSTWATRTVPTNENLNDGIGPTSGTSLVALVGGTNGVIFKTTDAGVNWTSISSNVVEDINSFNLGPTGYVFAACGNGIIIRSTDYGDSWEVATTSTTEDLLSIDASKQNANWLITCGSNGTLLKSTDVGTTWFLQGSPTTENLFCVYAASNSVHFAGGNNGIFLKTTDGGGDPVDVDDELEIPSKFILNQNYPNPFNPSTKIKFTIPFVKTHRDASLHTTLKVYDVLGNEIATLVNEELPAGEYEIEFNSHSDEGQNLTSGTYFYRLQSENFVETKKMILLK
jgi:photosystem II stability/assembly factor-like uncharacterized protein